MNLEHVHAMQIYIQFTSVYGGGGPNFLPIFSWLLKMVDTIMFEPSVWWFIQAIFFNK